MSNMRKYVFETEFAPDGEMLGDHAFVLDGHLPAGERHHPGAERDVAVMQRRASQALAHGATIAPER